MKHIIIGCLIPWGGGYLLHFYLRAWHGFPVFITAGALLVIGIVFIAYGVAKEVEE